MPSVVTVHWYATLLRGDAFADALREIAPVAMRYGSNGYLVIRSEEDRYAFNHIVGFENQGDFKRWWDGPEMIDFRTRYASWFQVPVYPIWNEEICSGSRAASVAEVSA